MIKTLLKSLSVIGLAFVLHLPVVAEQDVDVVEQNSYEGLCDASAGIAIDDSHFLVGEDEGSKGECLHLYRKGESKSVTPFCHFNFTKQLRVDPNREIDIEGAARIGKRIYWITSHGRNKNGKLRPNRYRLFATDIAGTPEDLKLEWVGSYDGLVEDMLKKAAWSGSAPKETESIIDLLKNRIRLGNKKVPHLAPKKKGLNIEGLAVSPDRKGLLVGLRNPLDKKGRAIVLHIKNPEDLVTKPNASAHFGTPFYLDLDGLGVRSMAKVPGKEEYLIVAGSHGIGGPFRLFKWRGAQEDEPALIGKLDSEEGSSPEALVAYKDSQRVQILHDEGRKKSIKGTKCKDEEEQKNKRFSDRWYEVK
uniref:DUF3616 domain-containing protein n=1 Tax=Candidatus Kentrum sp. LPFa TaxID=2126335 RepID=A0A450X8R0_9GAMM|nr:MAG: Protein of unknown function (DUF3616) [Candidatus Kentron sp. LPFa]VFK25702.1 MAG: Protein of unknown function (DUF3616) [Candidatus Kentron sp. LPFa]